MRLIFGIAFNLCALFAFPILAAEVFDEAFDSTGQIRPQYAEMYAAYQKMDEAQKKKLLENFRGDFLGDNALHPLPRLIYESEIEHLRQGVAQRAEALRLFLYDHYSGKKTYEKEGIFPKGVLERIIDRYGETGYQGKLNPKAIAFIYGPDIVRGPDGSFFIIEDNPGYVGGLGDLLLAREALFKRIPEYEKVLEVAHHPEQFYTNLIARYKKIAKGKPVVMYSYSLGMVSDNEDRRMRKIMTDYGVDVVSPYSRYNKIKVEGDKTYLLKKDPNSGKTTKTEIGFLFLNGEPQDFGASEGPIWEKHLKEWAEVIVANYDLVKSRSPKLDAEEKATRKMLLDIPAKERASERFKLADALGKKNIDYTNLENIIRKNLHFSTPLGREWGEHPKGLIDQITKGNLESSYSPGVEFIGDKQFYMYVPELIEHYLKEKPLVANLPTVAAGENPEVINKFEKKPADYVIKGNDGRGGDAIFIGPKMTKKAIAEVIKLMRADPHSYIAQQTIGLSTFDGLIVDNRLLSWVGKGGPIISYVPWGRGQLIDSDGKVNLSGSGREVTIIPIKNPSTKAFCLDLKQFGFGAMPGLF